MPQRGMIPFYGFAAGLGNTSLIMAAACLQGVT